jgi:transketolase
MSSAHHGLDNLIAILDRNGLQVNGATSDVMDSSPLEDKFIFLRLAVKTIDGHDIKAYISALRVPFKKGSPSMIIADTTKCKGLSLPKETLIITTGTVPEKIDASIEIVDKEPKRGDG